MVRRTKSADATDQFVGAKLRRRRLLLDLTQQELAKKIGVTFQQIQKYEKGLNRIGAGRLYKIATELDVSVFYFYENLDSVEKNLHAPPNRCASESQDLTAFMAGDQAIDLCRAFFRMRSPATKKAILRLMRVIAAADEQG